MVMGIIEVGLAILKWWLGKQANNSEALLNFYKFAHSINKNHLGSEKAAKKWLDQAALLETELNKQTAIVHPIGK